MTVKKFFIVISVASLSLSYTGNAADLPTLPTSLDLPTALRMADEYNPELRQARERINESTSAARVTKSSMMPDISASGFYQRDDEASIGSFGGSSPPDDYYWRAGVQLTQPLYSGGKLRAASRSRQFELQATENDVTTARARVFADVYRKFQDAILAREVVVVREESLGLVKQQLQIASNRYAAGAGAKFDVLQAEVRVANAMPPLIRASSDYKTAIDDLRTTIGVMYPQGIGPTNISLIGEPEDLTHTADLDASIQQAVNNRPELQSTRNLRDATRETMKKNQKDRYPRFDLYAGYGIENDRFDPTNDTLEGWQVGVQATLNIFGGGEVSGEIARYRSQLAQLDAQLDAQELEVELQVRNAWTDTEEARELLAASELVIAQAKEALRLAQNRYSAGALTQLDVLSTELEFTQARLEKITASRNYSLAVVNFKRAIGDVPGIEHVEPEEQP